MRSLKLGLRRFWTAFRKFRLGDVFLRQIAFEGFEEGDDAGIFLSRQGFAKLVLRHLADHFFEGLD